MSELSDIKNKIKQIDTQLREDIAMDFNEQVRLKASRNALAREYNLKKSFYHKRIEPEY
jgi:hypothetical protein